MPSEGRRQRKTPLVSVLLPARNAEKWLGRALASLVRQTLPDIEIIVVDDGSEDGTAEIANRWAAKDPRIKLVRPGPVGLVEALNIAAQQASGEVVARQDADDVSHPKRLEAQVEELRRHHPSDIVVSCLVRVFPRSRVQEGFLEYERWLNSLVDPDEIALERFVESPVAHPSVLLPKRLLVRFGGWRDVGWPEDYDLWLRMMDKGVRFVKVPQFLYFWMDRQNRLTRTDPRYSKEAFIRAKAFYLSRGPLKSTRKVVVWGAGPTGKRLAKELIRLGKDVAFFVDVAPRKIGGTVAGGYPVRSQDALPAVRGKIPVVVAVSTRGARCLIREYLAGMGFSEGVDFILT